MRLLIVEDDPAIAEPLREGLTRNGYDVDHVTTGRDAAAAASDYDLVLLDLGLPDIDGKEVCREIRRSSDVPIIVVTARGDEIDRVILLELGADDYLVKPFGFRELAARITAVTRRTKVQSSHGASSLSVGPVCLDRNAHRVFVSGTEIDLTPKEFDLLAMLMERPGSVCTREDIIDRVWDPHWFGPTKTLDVHIAALRKKLGDPGLITTIRGVGYRFETSR